MLLKLSTLAVEDYKQWHQQKKIQKDKVEVLNNPEEVISTGAKFFFSPKTKTKKRRRRKETPQKKGRKVMMILSADEKEDAEEVEEEELREREYEKGFWLVVAATATQLAAPTTLTRKAPQHRTVGLPWNPGTKAPALGACLLRSENCFLLPTFLSSIYTQFEAWKYCRSRPLSV